MQLFNKFNIFSLVAIFIAMFITSFNIFMSSESRVKDAILNEQLSSSQIVANLIDNKMLSLRQMVNIQANVDIIKDTAAKIDSNEYPELRAKLDSYIDELFAKTDEVATIYVLDRNGIVISSNSKKVIGTDLSRRNYFINSMLARPTFIEPMFSQLADASVVIISEPLISEGKIVGAIAIAIDLATLSEQVFAESKVYFDSQMYVVNNNGLTILSKDHDDILNFSLRAFTWFDTIDLGKNSFQEVHEDGLELIVSTSYIKAANWAIVFIVKSETVFASIRSSFNNLLLINLVSLIAILLFVYLIIRKHLNKAKDIENIQNAMHIASQDNYFIFNESDGVLYCTKKCMEFLKIDDFNVLKQNYMRFNPSFQADGRPSADVIRENLELAKTYGRNEVEYTICDNNRKEILIMQSIVPIIYEKKPAFFILYKDLTEQKQNEVKLAKAKEEAENSARSKSDFLANMSHEIRTPMNGIIGLTYLAMQCHEEEKGMEYLKQIDSSAKSLLRIINDILDFSKIDAGKIEIERVSFQLEVLLEDLSVSMAAYAEKSNIDFLINIDDDVPLDLIGDPLRLSQVLTNLCSNALKFTKVGQVVLSVKAVSVGQDDTELFFSVQDTGIGIASEKLNIIFNSFSQADSSTTRQFGGTGLGLAISKNLVNLMGGELAVKSQVDVGTNFYFRLHFGIGQVIKREYFEQKLPALRILAVDDNQISLKLISKYLEKMVKEIDLVDNGEEALRMYEASLRSKKYYDILLLDWKMPNMDGIELAKRIRNIENAANSAHRPSILMVTAFNRDELMPQLKEMDIKDVLVKPVSSSKLWNCVSKAYYGSMPKAEELEGDAAPVQFIKQSVLLAEDNTINQMIATELLEKVGLVVDIANNGQMAVNMAKSRDYALILMDIQMPILDGLSACERIRNDSYFHVQPVIIAMTAHAMQGDREKSIAVGMQDHITKPINPDEFYQVLAKYLPQKSQLSSVGRATDS